MFARITWSGHVLLVVLTIVFLLSLFLNYIAQAVVLEYQREHNQILELQSWQQLEAKLNLFPKIDDLNTSISLGFIPDSLDINCTSGIDVLRFELKSPTTPMYLAVTYSNRR